jgi:hypothetical protein
LALALVALVSLVRLCQEATSVHHTLQATAQPRSVVQAQTSVKPRSVVPAPPSDALLHSRVLSSATSGRGHTACAAARNGSRALRNGTVPSRCDWDAPVLWSFPGSGNTWVRQLLEAATGYATGSVYNDPSLEASMQGERRCSGRVLVVKAHPDITPYEVVRHHAGASREYFSMRRKNASAPLTDVPWHGGTTQWDGTRWHLRRRLEHFGAKCARWRPRRALVVDREPLAAIWSEYQREWHGGANGGHVAAIRPGELDPLRWAVRALELARSYAAAWASYDAWLGALPGAEATLVVPFEKLTRECEGTLRRMLRWLAPPAHPPATRRAPHSLPLTRVSTALIATG